MVNDRQREILNITSAEEITTQEMLRKKLEKSGYSVTQATLSRDIKRLGLEKLRAASGKTCYRLPERHKLAEQPTKLLADVVLKLDYALNTVVLRCQAGTAQAACTVLDRLELPDVVGSIAGDDTIFLLARSESAAENLLRTLETRIWG